MANIKSAKKRIFVTSVKTERNKAVRSKVRTSIKKVNAAIEIKDKKLAELELKKAIRELNKAVSKGVYHKNTSSRKISRMYRAVNLLI